jgi:hypothetical protein
MLAFKILLLFAMTLPLVSAIIKGPDLVKNNELWICLLNYMVNTNSASGASGGASISARLATSL